MGFVGQAVANLGTALQLPEMGISEWLGQPNPNNNGLDYSNSNNAVQTLNSGGSINPSTGSPIVQGPPGAPAGYVPPANNPPANNNNNSNNNNNNNNTAPPQPSQNDLEMQQVDSAYGSAMDYLNRAEQAIRGYQPQVESSINSTYDTNSQLANTQKAQAERQIGTAQTDTQSRLQNAISAARQALQESLMGGKQRFGSASGVYKALGEYGTTKFQQASGQARDAAEQTYRSLQEQTQTLNENFTNAMTQLNTWKQTEMQKAQGEFMNKLMEIDSNRNEAAQNKSFQKIQLLQDMRSRADAIANQAWTFQQNLQLQHAAYGQQLSTALQGYGQQAGAGAQQAANTGANGINSVNMNPISASSNTNPLTPYDNMIGYKNPYGSNKDPYALQ